MKIGILPQIGVINKKTFETTQYIFTSSYESYASSISHHSFKPTFNNAHAWRMADRPNLGGFSAKPCKRKDKGCSTAAWLGSSECRWPKIRRKSMIHNLLKSSIFQSLGCVSTFPHTRPTKSAGLPESAEKKKNRPPVFFQSTMASDTVALCTPIRASGWHLAHKILAKHVQHKNTVRVYMIQKQTCMNQGHSSYQQHNI